MLNISKLIEHLRRLTECYQVPPYLEEDLVLNYEKGSVSVQVGDSNASSTRTFHAKVYGFPPTEEGLKQMETAIRSILKEDNYSNELHLSQSISLPG